MPARVAFMFLTIQGLSREDLWRQFFDGADPMKYTIYCHPKYPDRVPHGSVILPHIISQHVHTSWASISLVQATIFMLQEAVRNIENQRFILISDTCIPIIPFPLLYDQVFKQPVSSFSYNPDYVNSVDIQGRYKRFQNKKMIPIQKFMKAHQWFILDRPAAVLCAEGRHLRDFEKVFASDEHYFVNICNHYRIPFLNLRRTFVEFEYEKSHPKIFHEISLSFLQHLRNKGFFFMRKIRRPTILLP